MKKLETTIKRGVFEYTQVQRNENNAIYAQRIAESGTLVGHEVFRINQYPEREIMGNVIAAHEAMPGDNQFGVSAWSTGTDVNRAIAKYNLINQPAA